MALTPNYRFGILVERGRQTVYLRDDAAPPLHEEVLALSSEDAARRLLAHDELVAALGFAASVIKSGEPWTEECERVIDAALAKARAASKEG